MKTIKPFRLSVLPRPYLWRNQQRLGVAIMALADLNGPTPQILPDLMLWKDVVPTLDADGMIDMFVPKASPEYLVSGNAYTRHQQNKTSCMVRVEVDGLSKEIRVTGQRYWIDGKITKPQPFDSISITRANAFGGPSHNENPTGKGIASESGSSAIELPNVEDPLHPFAKPGTNIPVASFGPLSFLHPDRQQMMGSYSEAWLKQDFPGFFSDMDPLIFNAAPPDQRWFKRREAPLGEKFTIWNMHAETHSWQDRVPDWNARCFIRQHDKFQEVEMKASTVWFLPEHKRILLIYHGSVAITEDDAQDITHIMPALETNGQVHTTEHYEKIMVQRSDSVRGGLYAFRDDELISRNLIGKWLDSETSIKDMQMWQKSHLRAEAARNQMRAHAASQGLDPDEYFPILMGPEREYTPSDLPLLMEETEALEARMQEKKKDMRDQLLHNGGTQADPAYTKLIESIFHGDGLKPKGPPKDPKDGFNLYRNLEQIEKDAEFRSVIESGTGMPMDLDTTKQKLNQSLALAGEESPMGLDLDEKDRARMEKLNPLRKRMYLYSAHFQDGAIAASMHESERARNQILEKYQRDKDLSNLDLTGIDLSGLDLSAADFSHSFLEATDLTHCRLEDCNFSEAVLTRARMDNTFFNGANFTKANISSIDAANCIFEGAQITEAIFDGSSFTDCAFSQARFSDLLAGKLAFNHCDFNGATFDMSIINELSLVHCDMNEIAAFKLSIQGAKISQCHFDNAHLDSCMFFASELDHVNFDNVDFLCVGFAYHTIFSACSFRGARLKNSNFRDMDLQSMDFSNARLDSCDFSNANLSGCVGISMRTPQSMFIRSNLDGAVLSDSDLMYANFKKATLRGARMEKTNLFRANMEQVLADDTTMLDNSYKDQVNIYPLRNVSERRNQ